MNFPTSSIDQHALLMLAFNDDLLAGDCNSTRAKAVCEIAQQMRAMPLRGRSGAVPAEPVPVSGLRPPAAIARRGA